jgi:hypothetical protein
MSQESVEVVRAQFDATNRRDWAAAMNAYAEDNPAGRWTRRVERE